MVHKIFFAMNTKEQIEKAGDTNVLCLYKEGAFCKVYNQHAMLFIENIKQLKVAVKFIKIEEVSVQLVGWQKYMTRVEK